MALRIVPYTKELFDKLSVRVAGLPADYPLRYREFVDYYYATSEFCQLYLAMADDGSISAFQGVEWMPFQAGEAKHCFGFGSNFYAFAPGTGAYLLVNWMKRCDAGMVFGGSDDMNRVITRYGWTYFDGISVMFLNRVLRPSADDPPLRRRVKALVKNVPWRKALSSLTRRLPAVASRVQVVEESDFHAELLNFRSAFSFRFAPDLKYLAWRYSPRFPYFPYRVFRVNVAGRNAGYVVLLERERQVLVAQADGSDATDLAVGIALSVSKVARGPGDRREVKLACANPAMVQVFESLGFRKGQAKDRPFVLGKFRGGFTVNVPVKDWMVSFDWGDNGLRPDPGTML